MANSTMDFDRLSSYLGEAMNFIEFKPAVFTSDSVEGRFVVSERSCQPFGVLHGGVTALIAESLASTAALIACGFRRVAGVQLSINHIKAAPIGTEVFASARPVHVGQRIHVWDVTFFKVDNSAQSALELKSMGTKIAESRVTLMVGLSDETDSFLKPYARL